VLLVGFYVFFNDRHSLLNQLLLAISISFSLWTVSILIEWTNIHSNFILFVWGFQGLLFSLIAIFCIYFIYVFLEKKDVSIRIKAVFLALLAPVLLLSPTSLNLGGFDITNCDAFKFEGVPFKLYYTALGVFAMIWIIVLLVRKYLTTTSDFRRQISLMGTGIELFLFLFFIWTSLTYYLTGIGILPDSRLEMYGMFGMVIFIIYLGILIVKFKAFNIKLIATQALIFGLAVLIGAQFFFIKVPINFLLTGVTFVASIIFGYLLIKSIKKEIEQKEELAKLNVDLETLIKQREGLMHLITHKVKGSFTHSKYIFAGILDGTFGAINPDLQKMAEKGLESDNVGINTIDLILNTGNMQKGLIKYDMKKVDFRDIVLNSMSEKKVAAEARGLQIEKEIGENDYSVLGDAFWLKEAVNNFIENSIKYTKVGKITIGLAKEPARAGGNSKILFSVKDTGVGITDEDKKNLFTEGGRGKESVKVNVDSTGYGLFTVKLIIEAHKGRVWAESEGPGKGSQFYIELPVELQTV
jgi:signal transduction histidine kinase